MWEPDREAREREGVKMELPNKEEVQDEEGKHSRQQLATERNTDGGQPTAGHSLLLWVLVASSVAARSVALSPRRVLSAVLVVRAARGFVLRERPRLRLHGHLDAAPGFHGLRGLGRLHGLKGPLHLFVTCTTVAHDVARRW